MFMRGVFLAGACILLVATLLIGIAHCIIGEGLTLIFACGLIVWVPVLVLTVIFLPIVLLYQI